MTVVSDTLLMGLIILLVGARGRPQALRYDSELSGSEVDNRWDSSSDDNVTLKSIANTFLKDGGIQQAVVDVLRELNEEELRLLERSLGPRVDEIPLGDMPPVDDGALREPRNPVPISNHTEDALFPHIPRISREKIKEMRLEAIKNQIMSTLWSTRFPPNVKANKTYPDQRDLFITNTSAQTPTDLYTKKIQTYYPSCAVPRNTDQELWNNSDSLNLFFDLILPSGHQVNLVKATLRLYQLSQDNMTSPENCPPKETPVGPEDKNIRVTVYWYTRSLKRNRVKRRLLDSKIIPINKYAWTAWNIQSAVRAWHSGRENFGLAVQVEDEDGALLHANNFFSPINCSQESSSNPRPIPGFLITKAQICNNTGLHFDTSLSPMVDLSTVEFTEYERPDTMFYQRVIEGAGNHTEHKTRHHHHRIEDSPQRHLERASDSSEQVA